MGIIKDLLSDPGLVNQIADEAYDLKIRLGGDLPECFLENRCIDSVVKKAADINIIKERRFCCVSIIKLSAVLWYRGGISVYESTYDAISFDFSGCLMARFRMDGRYYAAHIHCDDNHQNDSRYVWANFMNLHRNRISDLTIFQPGHCLRKFKSTWGIIESDGTCYSILLEESQGGRKVEILDIIRHARYGRNIDDYPIVQQFAQIPQGTVGDGAFKTQRDLLNDFWKTRTWEVKYSKNSYNGC